MKKSRKRKKKTSNKYSTFYFFLNNRSFIEEFYTAINCLFINRTNFSNQLLKIIVQQLQSDNSKSTETCKTLEKNCQEEKTRTLKQDNQIQWYEEQNGSLRAKNEELQQSKNQQDATIASRNRELQDLNKKYSKESKRKSELVKEVKTHKSEIDELKKNEQCMLERNSNLENALTRSKDDAQQMHEKNSELENKITRLEAGVQHMREREKDLIADHKEKIAQHSTTIWQLQSRVNESEKTNQSLRVTISEKEASINELSHKLAKEMSTKLASNESSVENVSIKNRPMNVADEYSSIMTNQWLEAKGAIDELCGDEVKEYEKLLFLSNIIKLVEAKVKGTLQKIHQTQQDLLTEPMSVITNSLSNESTANSVELMNGDEGAKSNLTTDKRIPQEMTNLVGDWFRSHSDEVDLNPLIKLVFNSVDSQEDSDLPKFQDIWAIVKESEEVKDFIVELARLNWKMVIQRPQMEFKSSEDGKWLGDKYQDVFWNSDHVQDPILIEVYPMLYHSNHLMTKGKVLLLDPQKYQT